MILLHGTTRFRAECIRDNGPDPRYREPGGEPGDSGFSAFVEGGGEMFGTAEGYAKGKSLLFPNEGGAAILAMDVPDEVVLRAVNEWFPLSQGLVQFDPGSGIEELLAIWPSLVKEIREVQ